MSDLVKQYLSLINVLVKRYPNGAHLIQSIASFGAIYPLAGKRQRYGGSERRGDPVWSPDASKTPHGRPMQALGRY